MRHQPNVNRQQHKLDTEGVLFGKIKSMCALVSILQIWATACPDILFPDDGLHGNPSCLLSVCDDFWRITTTARSFLHSEVLYTYLNTDFNQFEENCSIAFLLKGGALVGWVLGYECTPVKLRFFTTGMI